MSAGACQAQLCSSAASSTAVEWITICCPGFQITPLLIYATGWWHITVTGPREIKFFASSLRTIGLVPRALNLFNARYSADDGLNQILSVGFFFPARNKLIFLRGKATEYDR